MEFFFSVFHSLFGSGGGGGGGGSSGTSCQVMALWSVLTS
jgi:hypothetical protein